MTDAEYEATRTKVLAQTILRKIPLEGISVSKMRKKVTSTTTRNRYLPALDLLIAQESIALSTGTKGTGNRIYLLGEGRAIPCFACGKTL